MACEGSSAYLLIAVNEFDMLPYNSSYVVVSC